MKFFKPFIVVFLLSLISGFFLPWWTIAIAAFIVGFYLTTSTSIAFFSGFIAGIVAGFASLTGFLMRKVVIG
jgi:hypothetical protein